MFLTITCKEKKKISECSLFPQHLNGNTENFGYETFGYEDFYCNWEKTHKIARKSDNG